MKMVSPEHVIEPGQSWEIDLLRPEDAAGVAGLFLMVYGKDYPIKTYIDPDLLTAENAAGRTISSVARTPKGDIVGHNALFCSAASDVIRESGSGVVAPGYRGGHGIFSQMIIHGQEVGAKKFGIAGIYGESVLNHVFSQKACRTVGWITQAVEVDLMPASAYAKEKSATGRVSNLVEFMTLIPRPHTVYLPQVYQEALEYIYGGLDDTRDLLSSQEGLPAQIKTRIVTQVFDFAQVARLAVHDAGQDFAAAIDQEEAALRSRGVVVIQVWLKLSWPWVAAAVDHLRQRGYLLGGLLPRGFDDDGLLMQKIIRRPNWEGMQLEFDRGKRIVDLAKTDWAEMQRRLSAE
ncbi:MAG: hypothetical protein HQK59_05165 [Deltaproteobacteria bacterium]|nr:hypothetical protein [Deltaproteobacteria bacterium]